METVKNGWKWWHTASFVTVLGVACYWNTLSAGFVYDDSRAVQKNSDLHPSSPWSNLLFNDFWGTPLTHSGSHKSYRPVCVASFRINFYLDGLNPRGYHAANIMLHGVVSWLVVVLAYELLGHFSHLPSLVSGTLFAVHPIHTEAVAGVVGRADVGASLFFIISLLAYIKASSQCFLSCSNGKCRGTRWPWLIVSMLFCAGAMLTKEQGITVIGVCIIYDVVCVSSITYRDILQSVKRFLTVKALAVADVNLLRKSCTLNFNPFCSQALISGLGWRLIVLAITCVVLLMIRMALMGSQPPDFSPSDNPAANTDVFPTRLLTFLYLPVVNFWLLLCPRVLSFDWSMDAIPLIESIWDLRNVVTLLFYASASSLGIYLLKRVTSYDSFITDDYVLHLNGNMKSASHRKKGYDDNCNKKGAHSNKHGHFSQVNPLNRTHLSSSEGSSTVIRTQSDKVALVAVAIIIVTFIPASNMFFYVGFVIAERILYLPSIGFCLLVGIGVKRLYNQSPSTVLKKLTAFCVCSLVILWSVKTATRNENWRDEESLYRSGIDVVPAKAWGNLGNVLGAMNRTREAEDAYRKALSFRSNMADTHYNLAILLAEKKRYKEAIKSYENAIRFRPRLAVAHLNLAQLFEEIDLKEEAIKILKNASTISGHGLKDPKQHSHAIANIKYNLGRMLADVHRLEEAITVYMNAVDTRPPHFEPQSLYNMIGEAFSAKGESKKAEKWYKESLKVKPDHIPALLAYAKHLAKMGRLEESEELFKKAQQVNAGDATTWSHYGQFLYDRKQVQKSAAMFTKAMELAPNDFAIVASAANYQREAGDYKKAEESYKAAAKLRPKDPSVHMNLGALLHIKGRLEQAERSYLQALTIRPGDQLTLENLRKLRELMRRGKKT